MRGRIAATCETASAHAGGLDAGADRHCQPVDTAAAPGVQSALVHLAQHRLHQPGAHLGGAGRLAVLARTEPRTPRRTTALRPGLVRSVLRRTWHQPVALDRAAGYHHL